MSKAELFAVSEFRDQAIEKAQVFLPQRSLQFGLAGLARSLVRAPHSSHLIVELHAPCVCVHERVRVREQESERSRQTETECE